MTHLADVRAFPVSRRHPHFNRDSLGPALAGIGVAYTHFPELGGRRPARRDSRNTAWRNSGFRGYADYMETQPFEDALASLMAKGADASTAIMCAEAVPWRCHRSLVSDALVAAGAEVLHILDSATKPHSLTPFARVVDATVKYDAGDALDLFSAS